jgi:cob(I)alamin adenosyltransferase
MHSTNFTNCEQLVKKEDELIKKIETCEECIAAIFSVIYKKAESIHIEVIEDIINAIHRIFKDLQTELLHIIFEKKILVNKFDIDKTERSNHELES